MDRGTAMGTFINRESIEEMVSKFSLDFGATYMRLANQKCPTMCAKLPFVRQGVISCLVYAKELLFIFSRDSKQAPFSFVSGICMQATWDESEYPQLSEADCVDDVVRIIELEDVLYYKKLDSLEPEHLDVALGETAAKNLAEQILEENIRTLQPDFEDAVDRMKQAYESLFRLENRLPTLIEKRLKEQFGESTWWSKGATHAARTKYTRRQQDPRRKWHLLKSKLSLMP